VPALRFSRGCYLLLFVFSISTFPLLNVNLAYTRDFLVSHPNMPLTPNYWHPPIHRHRAILPPTDATSVPSSHTCDVISWSCHLRRYIVDDTCGVTSRRRDTCPYAWSPWYRFSITSCQASSQSGNLPQCATWRFLLLCEFEVHCVDAYPLIPTPSFTGQGQYSCPFRHNLFYRKFPRGLNVSSLVVRIYLVN
jgi:hypothetical protein